jgi:(p)ppGpp synthase/HD superfamily hydrolase
MSSKHDHLHTIDIQHRLDGFVWQALNTAATAHETQKRKSTNEWYIVHPYAVYAILAPYTDDNEVLAAAVLHDTVEDTEMTLEDVEREFGANVALYVWGVTKDDTIEDWHDRNSAYLDRLYEHAPDESVMISLADKLANMRDQINEYENQGSSMWKLFHAGPEDQLWWFSSVLEVGRARLPGHPLVEQLADLLDEYVAKVIVPSMASDSLPDAV